jgi:hypothetical protein
MIVEEWHRWNRGMTGTDSMKESYSTVQVDCTIGPRRPFLIPKVVQNLGAHDLDHFRRYQLFEHFDDIDRGKAWQGLESSTKYLTQA